MFLAGRCICHCVCTKIVWAFLIIMLLRFVDCKAGYYTSTLDTPAAVTSLTTVIGIAVGVSVAAVLILALIVAVIIILYR